MAYADKLTHMRRMAIIADNVSGVVLWEGVNIGGNCLLKEVDWIAEATIIVHEDKVKQWAEAMDGIVVYQDSKENERWEPRIGVTRDE